MGTAADWLGVIFVGGLYGGFMLFRVIQGRKNNNLQPHVFPSLVLAWVFAGLTFGIVIQFHTRAFRWPLIPITLGLVLAFVGITLYTKRSSSRLATTSSSENKSGPEQGLIS